MALFASLNYFLIWVFLQCTYLHRADKPILDNSLQEHTYACIVHTDINSQLRNTWFAADPSTLCQYFKPCVSVYLSVCLAVYFFLFFFFLYVSFPHGSIFIFCFICPQTFLLPGSENFSFLFCFSVSNYEIYLRPGQAGFQSLKILSCFKTLNQLYWLWSLYSP